MEDTKIVILDADYDCCILGLLTVKDKTAEEICDIIAEVKAEVDCWTWEDILERLRDLNIDFSWEENVCSISI